MIGNLTVDAHRQLGPEDALGVERFLESSLGLSLDNVFIITVDDDPRYGLSIEVGQFRLNEDGHKFLGAPNTIAWEVEMFERLSDGQYAHLGTEVMV
jgi:hypothetical protein